MRIALGIMFPADVNRRAGGLKNVAANLVTGFRRRAELEVHIVDCNRDVARDEVESSGNVSIHRLAAPTARLLPNLLATVWKARREFACIHPNVVNAHIAHYATAAILAGLPTVYTIHGIARQEARVYRDTWFDRLRYGLAVLYDTYATKRATRIVAISPYVEAQYGDRVDWRWRRVDVPIADEFFTVPDRTVPGRIFCAGTIDERKNGLGLLQALVKVREQAPEAHVHFGGRVANPEYFQRMQAFVGEHRLTGHVVFPGLLDFRSLLAAYSECAFLALTSRQETTPAVIIEAAAGRKPSVSMLVGGVEDILDDGVTGYIVPMDDQEAFAERVARLLRDPSLRAAMGQRAHDKLEQRCRIDRVVGRYLEVYAEAVAACAAKGRRR